MTTDNFLMGLRKHIAEHAALENVYSDVGSNIAGGGKRLEEDQDINIDELKIFSKNGNKIHLWSSKPFCWARCS